MKTSTQMGTHTHTEHRDISTTGKLTYFALMADINTHAHTHIMQLELIAGINSIH